VREEPRTLDGLAIRRRLGRQEWSVPEPYGPDGWSFLPLRGKGSILVSAAPMPGDWGDWVHASIHRPEMPTYDDLALLHYAVWGTTGWSYQLFTPEASHVNINEHALHLWGRPDGRPELPDFGSLLGSI
jgi:hypothetical protein